MKAFTILSFLFLASCMFGPKLKNNQSYLNGENFSTSGIVSITKDKKSKIAGIVLYKLEDSINFSYSEGYKAILKNRLNEEVDTYFLQRDGKFKFLGKYPDGDYLLEIRKGEKTIKLKRIKLVGYKLENLQVYL